jgi:hypothetical protein
MKLSEAIELKSIELLQDYKKVEYSHNEIIKMKANSEQNNYISKELSIDTEIEEINNRFEELDNENHINAVLLVFNVKAPHKRIFMQKKIYYRITEGGK